MSPRLYKANIPREEFKRVRQQLQARGLIRIRDDLAWKGVIEAKSVCTAFRSYQRIHKYSKLRSQIIILENEGRHGRSHLV
jgi:hypothetical protein